MSHRKSGLLAMSRKSFNRLRNFLVLVSSTSASMLIFWLEAYE
jgi:hypothetical protein